MSYVKNSFPIFMEILQNFQDENYNLYEDKLLLQTVKYAISNFPTKNLNFETSSTKINTTTPLQIKKKFI